MLLEMSVVPASIVSTERDDYLDGYVTTPRTKYGCGKWGAWLFVHSVSFSLQEHVKTTQTDKTRFLRIKKWTCSPTNNWSLMSLSKQPIIGRKNCGWTTQYKRLFEMCIVQHIEMKSVFTMKPIKYLVSTTVKSARPAGTFWKCLLRIKNQQLCCVAVMIHIILQEKRMATK